MHALIASLITFAVAVVAIPLVIAITRADAEVGTQFTHAIDRAFGAAALRIGHQITLPFRETVDGVVLLGLAQGVFMATMYAVFGVPHPILLGLLSSIGAMVPFGLIAVMLIALALLAVKGAAIAVGAIVGTMSFIVDHTAKPASTGGATKHEIRGGDRFHANRFVVPPRCRSTERHWREGEDELVAISSGDGILGDHHGKHPMTVCDVADFPKNDGSRHKLVNEGDAPLVPLTVSRSEASRVVYSDINLVWRPGGGGGIETARQPRIVGNRSRPRQLVA